MNDDINIATSDPRAPGAAALYLTFNLYRYLVGLGAISPSLASHIASQAAEIADTNGQSNSGALFEEAADLCRAIAVRLRELPEPGTEQPKE